MRAVPTRPGQSVSGWVPLELSPPPSPMGVGHVLCLGPKSGHSYPLPLLRKALVFMLLVPHFSCIPSRGYGAAGSPVLVGWIPVWLWVRGGVGMLACLLSTCRPPPPTSPSLQVIGQAGGGHGVVLWKVVCERSCAGWLLSVRYDGIVPLIGRDRDHYLATVRPGTGGGWSCTQVGV